MPLRRTQIKPDDQLRRVQLPLNRVTNATLTPLNVDQLNDNRRLPIGYELTTQLLNEQRKQHSDDSDIPLPSTPTTVRLESETTDSAQLSPKLSPNAFPTPPPTSTDMSRRQIQLNRMAYEKNNSWQPAPKYYQSMSNEPVIRNGQPVSRAPSVTFSQKHQTSYDERSNVDRSPKSERQQQQYPPQPHQQTLKRPGDNMSMNGVLPAPSSQSQFSPSELSEMTEQPRRGSRNSVNIRQSLSQYDLNAGQLAVYNHMDHQLAMPMPPPHPAMLSHAPSMGQLWFPAPPPPFTPYYYAPALGHTLPSDPKAIKKAMKEAQRMEKEHILAIHGRKQSFCCDSLAQLLWAIIIITMLGFVVVFLLAFFVLPTTA